MRRRRAPRTLPSESSDDDEPLSKIATPKPQTKPPKNDDSSSDSDIENYLQKADKIDLNSPFFNLQNENPPSFDQIESDILAGVKTLTDSDSENETAQTESQAIPSTSKMNFPQLHEYTKKLEEAKRHVEEYNARKQAKNTEMDIENLLKQARNTEMDIENLLAAGESKLTDEKRAILEATLHSSDFESCSDSEKGGWEEVEETKKEKSVVPQEGLQITVEMPGPVRKKKGVDLLAAIKRRINRVRKENQLLIHKVHLLCWVAHGNYVNAKINSQNVLAVALSLLPSQQCYPPNRTDLSYLEQIVKWYRNTVVTVEKNLPEDKSLEELLEEQIMKKTAYNYKMLVYIFVAIMRSLGIQCRLVLSFQVEPLRPPNSELHSLSTKVENKTNSKVVKKDEKKRSESTSEASKLKVDAAKSRSKSCDVSTSKTDKRESSKSKKTSEISKATATIDASKLKLKPNSKESRSKVDNNKNVKLKAKTRAESTSEVAKTRSQDKKQIVTKEKSNLDLQPKTKPRSKSASEALKPKQDKEKNVPIVKIKLQAPKNSKPKPEVSPKPKSGSNKETSKTKNPRQLRTQKDLIIPQLDGANDSPKPSKPNLRNLKHKEPPCPLKTHPKRLKTTVKYRDTDSEDEFTPRSPFSKKNSDSPKTNGAKFKKLDRSVDVRSDIINLVKKSIKEQKQKDRSKTVRKRKSGQNSDNDSDYAPEAVKKKHHDSDDEFTPKVKVKKRLQVNKSEEDEAKTKKKQGIDVWAEVFLETEEKWISVDLVKGRVHCVNELYTRATHPVGYVVAWDNDSKVKDITKRYCTNFNTVTRKLRIDAQWWEVTLSYFTGAKTVRDKEEDEELERQQLEKPLPTSIAEYKDHPLYVLRRHLLKFQAIYPPDAPTLGFVRNEPVYSRQCVYTLHSRDIWLKQAKVVKLGEKPYKIVKARPKWDKLSNSIITDQLLEIFGPWQTQDYDSPTAENGVVPRNAFGNVDLFKTCMLPKKTVHLRLPGLNKIAKRMNIDCASAIVGFDFHGGWSHPTYDGFVVCEEFADILSAAWDLEQDELEKKEEEKIEKRVYGHWKRLIKGLLIRERLKVKYEFGDITGEKGKKKAKKGPKMDKKKRRIESGSESD